MIIDSLEKLELYAPYIPHLTRGLACLKAHREDAAPARYDFPGGYMMLQEGTTRPVEDGDYEAHRVYLDVQVLLEGSETVVWADTETLEETIPYDGVKDKVMYAGPGSVLEVKPGMCYLCWPHDAHKACRCSGTPGWFRKAVIKLSLDDSNCENG